MPVPTAVALQGLYDWRICRYFQVGYLALLIYDYLLTFSEEARLIWGAKWTKGRILFVMIRYVPFVYCIMDNVSGAIGLDSVTPRAEFRTSCVFDFYWTGYVILALQVVIGSILILRLTALYPRYPSVKIGLFLFLGLSTVSDIVLITLTVPHLTVVPDTPTVDIDASLCLPLHFRSFSWACWLPFIIMESVLFLLALAKGIHVWLAKDAHKPRLLVVLLRDSILGFGGVLLFLIPNLVLWVIERQTLRSMLIGGLPAVQSIIGSRMLLNIYETTETKIISSLWLDDDGAILLSTSPPDLPRP